MEIDLGNERGDFGRRASVFKLREECLELLWIEVVLRAFSGMFFVSVFEANTGDHDFGREGIKAKMVIGFELIW